MRRGLALLALYGLDDEHPPNCSCKDCDTTALADGLSNRWRKIPAEVASSFLEGVWQQEVLPNRLHRGLWVEHFERLLENAEAGWGKKFSDPDNADEWELTNKMQQNIRSLAAHKQHRMVEELRDWKAKGLTREAFDKKAAAIMKRHERYLRAEVQGASARAASARQWQDVVRTAYLYPNIKYLTAADERVRQSHRPLHGVVRPVNDPFWDTYLPPNGWGCRCHYIQTDDQANEAHEAVDFEPPKGFRDNPGKSGKLFSDDHPYFDVPGLDREAIESQAKNYHAAIARESVRDWAKEQDFEMRFPGSILPVTMTNREVKTITGKPHQDAPRRNALLYVLGTITDRLRFIGSAPDSGAHPQVKAWYYYAFAQDGIEYFLNLWKLTDDAGKERMGIHAITDNPPDFGGP